MTKPPENSDRPNSERPARRFTGKPRAKAPRTPFASLGVSPFAPWTAMLQNAATPSDPGALGTAGETTVNVAAQMIAWPMEMWMKAAYANYELMLDLYDQFQKLDYNAESISSQIEERVYSMNQGPFAVWPSVMAMSGRGMPDLFQKFMPGPRGAAKKAGEW